MDLKKYEYIMSHEMLGTYWNRIRHSFLTFDMVGWKYPEMFVNTE